MAASIEGKLVAEMLSWRSNANESDGSPHTP